MRRGGRAQFANRRRVMGPSFFLRSKTFTQVSSQIQNLGVVEAVLECRHMAQGFIRRRLDAVQNHLHQVVGRGRMQVGVERQQGLDAKQRRAAARLVADRAGVLVDALAVGMLGIDRRGGGRGLISICAAGGQGVVAVVEK